QIGECSLSRLEYTVDLDRTIPVDRIHVCLRGRANGQLCRGGHLDHISRWLFTFHAGCDPMERSELPDALALRHAVASVVVGRSAPVVWLKRGRQEFTPTNIIGRDGARIAADGD